MRKACIFKGKITSHDISIKQVITKLNIFSCRVRILKNHSYHMLFGRLVEIMNTNEKTVIHDSEAFQNPTISSHGRNKSVVGLCFKH